MWIQGEAVDAAFHVTARPRSRRPSPGAQGLDAVAGDRGGAQQVPGGIRRDGRGPQVAHARQPARQQDRARRPAQGARRSRPPQIAAYYNKHHSQYTTPETRNLHLVLVAHAATAQKVHSLLAGGASYATVAPKYSIDATSKANGGAMLGVTTSELTPVLSNAVFAAKAGGSASRSRPRSATTSSRSTRSTPADDPDPGAGVGDDQVAALPAEGPTAAETGSQNGLTEEVDAAHDVPRRLHGPGYCAQRAEGLHRPRPAPPPAALHGGRRAPPGDGPAAVGRLDQLTRRLRRDCPWDRTQDARSIVSHTVEEAYELADAAHARR